MRKNCQKGTGASAVVLMAILALLLAGCGGLGSNSGVGGGAAIQDSPKILAYKTLASAAKTYDATMKSLAELYQQKIIDDQVKNKAVEYGKVFRTAYNKALDAMEAGNTDISAVSKALADFLGFAQPYILKTGGK